MACIFNLRCLQRKKSAGDCGAPRRFHVSFENWLTGSPWTQQWLQDLIPYGVPADLGSMGDMSTDGPICKHAAKISLSERTGLT